MTSVHPGRCDSQTDCRSSWFCQHSSCSLRQCTEKNGRLAVLLSVKAHESSTKSSSSQRESSRRKLRTRRFHVFGFARWCLKSQDGVSSPRTLKKIVRQHLLHCCESSAASSAQTLWGWRLCGGEWKQQLPYETNSLRFLVLFLYEHATVSAKMQASEGCFCYFSSYVTEIIQLEMIWLEYLL